MRWAFRAYLVVGLFTGCGSKNTPPLERELTVGHHEVMRLTTRFGVEQVEEEIPAKHAFLIRKACPKIQKASLRKEKGATMALLTISGEQMETVWGVSGRSVDGKFGIAPVKYWAVHWASIGGGMVFAVAGPAVWAAVIFPACSSGT